MSAKITKTLLKEFAEKKLATHTDWTGTRVETKNHCDSVDKFVGELWEFIENNQPL